MQRIQFVTSILFLFLFVQNGIAQGNVKIYGRVIDSNGRPVANAQVYLWYPPCKGCSDHIITSMETVSEGLFYQDTDHLKNVRSVRLIIEAGINNDYFKLIYDPARQLAHLPKYSGIVIDTKKNKTINLKDVQPSITYKTVSLNISKYLQNSPDLFDISFSVKDSRGIKVASEVEIPSAFWDGPSNAKLMLPMGRWLIELKYVDDKNSTRIKNFLFDLRCGREPVIREIVMALKGN